MWQLDSSSDASVVQRRQGPVTYVYKDMRLTGADQVILATRLLEADARNWWVCVRPQCALRPLQVEFVRELDE